MKGGNVSRSLLGRLGNIFNKVLPWRPNRLDGGNELPLCGPPGGRPGLLGCNPFSHMKINTLQAGYPPCRKRKRGKRKRGK